MPTRHNPIVDFLQERKQAKLKSPGKKSEQEIEDDFRIENWVEHAAKRAAQLSLVTHPGKFSHPDARITPILFEGSRAADGYLRSGNVVVKHDVVGNAAALDVYGFLSVELEDQRSVLDHFETDSDQLRQLLGVNEGQFQQWRTAFLQIKSSSSEQKTAGQIKQVYFPVEDGYHLLSVLYPSGLITAHRERIQQMKFSDEVKEARQKRKDGEHHELGFFDLPGLLTQKFGGTKPQNISKLNSGNGGMAWLMPSMPPMLKGGYQQLPKQDFFQFLRWDAHSKSLFRRLHTLFKLDLNNRDIRKKVKETIAEILEWVLLRALYLQQSTPGWSDRERYQIPELQKIWLDQQHFENRADHPDWQEAIAQAVSEWIVVTYRRIYRKRKDQVTLGEIETTAFQKEILKTFLQQQKEFII